MSNERLLGLELIKIGATSYNTTTGVYSMPSTFTTIPALVIVPDSASITVDTPEPTNFDTEGSDDPDISIPGARKVTGEFATYDMGASVLALLMGGTASNSTIYKASSTTSAITEKSMRLVSKTINGKKHTVDFPRVSLRAGGQLKFAKATPGSLTASFVMLNAGPNTPPYKKTKS